MTTDIFTIGHSAHSMGAFRGLLGRHRIDVVADVRSAPYSGYNPQFNQGALRRALAAAGIKYMFLGKELGARSADPLCYVDGKVRYTRLADKPDFKRAIGRLVTGARKGYRIAIMCAEKEPLECHRTLLVAQALDEAGQAVRHILADGVAERHADTMGRLYELTGVARRDMFMGERESLREALMVQEERVAYRADNKAAASRRVAG